MLLDAGQVEQQEVSDTVRPETTCWQRITGDDVLFVSDI